MLGVDGKRGVGLLACWVPRRTMALSSAVGNASDSIKGAYSWHAMELAYYVRIHQYGDIVEPMGSRLSAGFLGYNPINSAATTG